MATNPQSNLDVIVRGVDELSPQMKTMESRVIRFVGAVGASLAALRIVSFPVLAAAQFEREMANVTKTTNFSVKEIKRLGDELRAMSLQTSTSAMDLAKIAAAGGQLGLGREGVEGIRSFTDSVQRMSVVLDLVPEEAASQFGKIKNIFNTNLSDMERVVSAFNQTSNNTTASGKDLLDVVRRLGNASGTVNLQQSIGLAASALDFGVSPEVAGTSLSKMFASLLQRADKFAGLMKVSTKSWVEVVSKDGVEGFKQALDALRKLDASAQQTAIVKLFGGGRIGSLASKYVQDVNNSVMDRDIFQASQGYANGLSALREQATVLNTLTEQAKILYNSIEKDAIEAGDQLSGDLINHVRDLTKSLQDPGVQSFINQLVASVGDLVNFVAKSVSIIAGWNINWDNFIRMAKGLIALKVVDVVVGITSSVFGLDAQVKKLAVSAALAGKATKDLAVGAQEASGSSAAVGASNVTAANETATAWQRTKATYRELVANHQQTNELLAQELALTKSLANARQQSIAADTSRAAAKVGLDSQHDAVAVASARTGEAAAAVENAARAQMNAELSIREEGAKRIAARTAQHEAEITAIMAEGVAKQSAARKLGRSKSALEELEIAKTWQQNMLLSEEATYNRSMAGLKKYWLDREVLARAAGTAEGEILVANLVKQEALEDSYRARLLTKQAEFDALIVSSTAATAKVVELEAATAAVGPALAVAAKRGIASWTSFILVMNLAKSAVQTVLSLAMKWFLPVTILLTLADMVGLLDKMPGIMQKVTDWTGFTSKATRDLAVAKEQETKAHEKNIAKLDESIDRYKKLQSEQGKYTKELAAVDAGRHKTADINTAKAADANLLTVIQGAKDEEEKNKDELAKATRLLNSGTLQKRVEEAKAAVAAAQAAAADTAKDGEKRTQMVSLTGKLPLSSEGRDAVAKKVAEANEAAALAVTKANAALDEQKKALEFATKAANGEYLTAMKETTAQVLVAAEAYVTRYIPATADAFLKQTPAILASFAAQTKAQEDFKKASDDLTAAQNAKDEKGIALARGRMAEANSLSTQAGLDLAKAQKELEDFANARAKSAATPQEKVAWEELARQAHNTAEEITGASRAINIVRNEGMEHADVMLAKVGLSLEALAGLFGTTKEKVLQRIREMITEASPLLAQLSPAIQGVLKDITATVGNFFSGATARSKDTPTTGTEGGSSGESEARKIAKAKIKLQTAELAAGSALRREQNQQELDADERKYNQGLRAMEDYYAERKRVLLKANDDEIAARQREMVEIIDARDNATSESERLQYEAQQVRLEGQIKLLRVQKNGITAENRESLRAAKEAFDDQINSSTVDMFKSLTLDGTVSERWKASLNNEYARYRLFLRQIESETMLAQKKGDTARVEQLKTQSEAVTRAYVAAAFSSALDGLNAKADVSYNAVAQYQHRLEALRGEGAITAQEAEVGLNQVIAAQIPLLQEQLRDGEALLTQQTKGSLLYNQQAQAVEEMRLRLRELGLEANKTAREINAGIGDSLKEALSKLEPTMNSLKDVVLGFLKDVTDQLQKRFTDNIADQIMGKVDGTDGAGGLGGWIATILGQGVKAPAAGEGTQPKGDATSPIYAYTLPAPSSNLLPGAVTTPGATGIGGGATLGTFGILAGAAQGAMGGGGLVGGLLGGVMGGMSAFGGSGGIGGATTLGASEANPLYVTVVGGNAGGGGAGGLLGGIGGMLGSMLGGGGSGAGFGSGTASVMSGLFSGGNVIGGNTITAGFGSPGGDSSAGSAKAIQDLGGIFTTASTQSTQAITASQQSASTATVGATQDVTSAVGSGFSGLFSTIASSVMSLILAIRTSGSSGGGGGSMGMGIAGMLGSFAGQKLAGAHTGGVIGATTLRVHTGINPAIFASASRYHNGGVVGLGPDEVPIIAKKGEEMLTARDARHRDNLAAAGGGGAPVQMAQTLVFDTQAAAKAILTGANLVTAIKPNVKTVRQLLGIK